MAFSTNRAFLNNRLEALRRKREGEWDAQVEDILRNVAPYRLQYSWQRVNDGQRKDWAIYNTRPQRSLRTLAAGMMAGITSPARRWAKMGTTDASLMDHKDNKMFLAIAEQYIFAGLAQSNFYKELSSAVYLDIGGPGTAAMLFEETPTGLFKFRAMPWGEYFLDINDEGKVDTCFREIDMTVKQLAKKFGPDRLTENMKLAYESGKYEKTFTMRHAIFPNEDYHPGLLIGGVSDGDFYDPDSPISNSKPVKSCWWSKEGGDSDPLMWVGGYNDSPIIAPRWSAAASDAYGRGPGWDSLPDMKVLQHNEKRLMQMIDLATMPPLKLSGEVKKASLLPGALVYMGNEAARNSVVEPILKIAPGAIEKMQERIGTVESRISEGFYAHLWQMLINDDRNARPTATEVEARRQEVALQLGPLLESLNEELLEPVIERAFGILERSDRLPLPPEDLEGTDVKVEFVSVMHQQQQATGLTALQTMMNELGVIAQMFPEALDKINVDEVINDLQQITGVKPDVVRDADEVASMRQSRQAQEQAQQQGDAMVQATQGMKNLGSVDPKKLGELAETMGPVVAAQGGQMDPLLGQGGG